MDVGHRDDAVRRVELGFGKRRARVQSLDDVALQHAGAQVVLAHVRVEIAELERREPMLFGETLDDAHEEVDAAPGAGVSRRPYDHRHAEFARGEQHLLEIVGLPRDGTGRDIAPQRHGPDVVAAGVGRNVIRTRRDPELETSGAYGCETQMSVGTDDFEGSHRGP
jgi:hypothetical protein